MMRSASKHRRLSSAILLSALAGLTAATGDAAAQQAPYSPAAKLEEALGGLGSRAGARWYDPGTRVIFSTDPHLSVYATTAFHLSQFAGVCPSDVGLSIKGTFDSCPRSTCRRSRASARAASA
jgi:hypothetical protein